MRTVICSGRSPSTSATVCARTVPTPVPISCTLESTSTEPSRITRTSQAALVCTLAPQSDCATPRPRFTGPGSAPGACRRCQPIRVGADSPLLAAHRTRIDAVAQCERIDAEPFGQFIDGLFEAKCAGRVAGRAHRAARPGIDEHVVLRAREIGTGIKRLGVIADTGAKADAGRAVTDERDRGERTVALGADAQSLPSARPIARVHLFLFAIEEQAHRCLSAPRQFNGETAVIAQRAIWSQSRRPWHRRRRGRD